MFTVTRKIEIDAGHRVPHHGSKCRNFHGHRYVVEATLNGDHLIASGEETGMVRDFGHLKADMVRIIDDPCDHALLLWQYDPWLLAQGVEYNLHPGEWARWEAPLVGRVYVMAAVPTAENLAHQWFLELEAVYLERLMSVKVWETPNCWAVFSG